MSSLKSRLFRTCPKSGRIVGVRQPEGWARLWFPLIGLAAAIWFALRVLPKPSRAAYPCQRVAMPLASGFVLWLAGIGGASLALGPARARSFRQARWLSGGLAVLVALVGVGWARAQLPAGQPGQHAAGAGRVHRRIRPTSPSAWPRDWRPVAWCGRTSHR
jgi:hypothetical protein